MPFLCKGACLCVFVKMEGKGGGGRKGKRKRGGGKRGESKRERGRGRMD
jgi:hypothetical protein